MTRDELITRYDAGERDFRRVNLTGADLAGANLEGANLWGADLRRADLSDANLRCANLRNANIQVANLAGADLRDADLGGANLWSANLQRADLRGANLFGANLNCIDLSSVVVNWPIGWPPGTIVRCQACQCGKTKEGYIDARVILASQVGDTVHILHEGNDWVLTLDSKRPKR